MLFYPFRVTTLWALMALALIASLAFGGVDHVVLAAVELVVAGLALCWAFRARSTPFPFVSSALYVPFVAIVAAIFAQMLLGASADPNLTAGELAKWLCYTAFFVLSVNVQADPTLRRGMMRLLATLGFVLAAIGLAQAGTSDLALWFRPAPSAALFGPFAQGEHFAVMMELLFPAALWTALEDPRRRGFHFVACGLIILAAAACGSRIGLALIGLEFAVIVGFELFEMMTAVRASRQRRVAPLFGIAVLLLVLAGSGWIQLRVSAGSGDNAAHLETLGTVWSLFGEKPLLGYGVGSFATVFSALSPEGGRTWAHADCDPLQLAMELGITGIAAQVLLAGLILIGAKGRRAWLAAVLPLAVAWVHSWWSFPLQIPAVVLAALLVLGRLPGETMRRVRFRRPPRLDDEVAAPADAESLEGLAARSGNDIIGTPAGGR